MTMSRRGFIVGTGALVALSACADDPVTPRTDVPEPAVAPPTTAAPAGTVVPMPGTPEGMAISTVHGLVAVGVRDPHGVVLVDAGTGRQRRRISLSGAPRHLQVAGPAGPVLVPVEGTDRLYQIALPQGRVIAETVVGDNPHDAAAVGEAIFVGDEFADTVSIIRNGTRVAVVPAPTQPGGVAASADGTVAVVVGVRGRQIEAYAPDGRSFGRAPAGVGPTHVRAGREPFFYVADTQGDAVLVFEAGEDGVHQVGRVATGAAPYGLAVDTRRERVYATLTGTNQLPSFRISGRDLLPDEVYPTVRQPNDVAVNELTGRLVVAGAADSVLQLIDPVP